MKGPGRIELTQDQVEDLIATIERSNLPEAERKLVVDLIAALRWMNQSLEEKSLSIRRLQKIFGIQTEKASHLLEAIEKELDQEATGTGMKGESPARVVEKTKGHGRLGADDYISAKTIHYSHATLKVCMRCPGCGRGNLSSLPAGKLLRITAMPPLQATVHRPERLRCNTCNMIYTAEVPKEIGDEKYDVSACSMVSLLRYGYGFPMNRMDHLQNVLGVPLPASTQWELITRVVETLRAFFDHLVTAAAQGRLLHNDDTTVKILEFMGKRKGAGEKEDDDPERTGIFTTGIVSQVGDHKIMLFFSGHAHAGENLEELLTRRDPHLPVPLQMCDALSRNEPSTHKTVMANCVGHGRRNFYEIFSAFPDQVKFVITLLRGVYRNDALAKEQHLSDEERLRLHQKESAPLMDTLKEWIAEQMDNKRVEPNSSLGKAMQYMKNHWEKLTRFLQVPGAPLTNDECERLIKTAVRHRKNSLFYKTQPGAEAGDILMSVIQTAIAAGVNPFDYLNALQTYHVAVAKNPEAWFPWNYQETLKAQDAPPNRSSP